MTMLQARERSSPVVSLAPECSPALMTHVAQHERQRLAQHAQDEEPRSAVLTPLARPGRGVLTRWRQGRRAPAAGRVERWRVRQGSREELCVASGAE